MTNSYAAKLLAAVAACRRGATAVEYGLIAALIAAAIAGVVGGLGDQLGITFGTVTTELTPPA